MAPPPTAQPRSQVADVAFSRRPEPNEQAFMIPVPTGWTQRGSVFRVNAAQPGGPLNAPEVKCDFAFMRDQHATVR